MAGRALGPCWYRFRASFAQQRGAYFALVLLVALLGGSAMAAVAGARRTQSAFPTYLASTHPSDLTVPSGFDDPAVGLDSGYDPPLIARIAHLPGVAGLATYVGFDGNIDNIRPAPASRRPRSKAAWMASSPPGTRSGSSKGRCSTRIGRTKRL